MVHPWESGLRRIEVAQGPGAFCRCAGSAVEAAWLQAEAARDPVCPGGEDQTEEEPRH